MKPIYLTNWLFLCLFFSFPSFSQDYYSPPNWEINKAYKYKLTYTIDAPGLAESGEGPVSVHLFNTFKVVEDLGDAWKASLTFDKYDLKGNELDHDAKRRFWMNTQAYSLEISKDYQSVKIDGIEILVTQLLDFSFGGQKLKGYEEWKEKYVSDGGLSYLLDSDFKFLFDRPFTDLNLNEEVVQDSLNAKEKITIKEKLIPNSKNDLVYLYSNLTEQFERADTAYQKVLVQGKSEIEQKKSISYNKELIPFHFLTSTFYKVQGRRYYELGSTDKVDLDGGEYSEIVEVELLNP